MNPAIKKKWVEWLRSGDYEQGKKYLCAKDPDVGYRCCCLGVLIDVVGAPWFGSPAQRYWSDSDCDAAPYINTFPSRKTLDLAGLPNAAAENLAIMNDAGVTFDDIADWIEEHL